MTSFRRLKADEIQCRVATISENGVSLLLYKDARCDMNILDETVGCDMWQCRYYECKGNDTDALKIQDNTVSLRVTEHEQAINAFLSMLCLQVGFSAGTFTFDKASGIKTATEVISENSKTYKTIKSHQMQVKAAIDQIVDAIIQVAALYDMTWEGQRISELAERGWETKVVFDDSILQDRQTNINEGILLKTNGLMSTKRFMIEVLGYTEEEAFQEMQEIKEESTVNDSMWDVMEATSRESVADTPSEEPEAREGQEEASEDES